jgi:hypothetical protein
MGCRARGVIDRRQLLGRCGAEHDGIGMAEDLTEGDGGWRRAPGVEVLMLRVVLVGGSRRLVLSRGRVRRRDGCPAFRACRRFPRRGGRRHRGVAIQVQQHGVRNGIQFVSFDPGRLLRTCDHALIVRHCVEPATEIALSCENTELDDAKQREQRETTCGDAKRPSTRCSGQHAEIPVPTPSPRSGLVTCLDRAGTSIEGKAGLASEPLS